MSSNAILSVSSDQFHRRLDYIFFSISIGTKIFLPWKKCWSCSCHWCVICLSKGSPIVSFSTKFYLSQGRTSTCPKKGLGVSRKRLSKVDAASMLNKKSSDIQRSIFLRSFVPKVLIYPQFRLPPLEIDNTLTF